MLDIDTVKGCACGMDRTPRGGCYGLCYACRLSLARGFDFRHSVSRQPLDEDAKAIERTVKAHRLSWFRIGVMGDPSHDWPLTLYVAEWLGRWKTPVVVTKHWRECPGEMLRRMVRAGVVFNTSLSALDSAADREHRLTQFYRVKREAGRSWLRVVTADFGGTAEGRYAASVQRWLLMHGPVIDNPLRIPATDERVRRGDIRTEATDDVGSRRHLSRWSAEVYVGRCAECPDQCGAI